MLDIVIVFISLIPIIIISFSTLYLWRIYKFIENLDKRWREKLDIFKLSQHLRSSILSLGNPFHRAILLKQLNRKLANAFATNTITPLLEIYDIAFWLAIHDILEV